MAADGCNALQSILVRIDEEREKIPSWALTIAPSAVERAQHRLADLQLALKQIKTLEDQARRRQLIDYANAMGTSIFILVGLAVSGTAAPLVFAGSVLYGSGLLVVRGLAVPESVDAVNIARDVGMDRMGRALDATSNSPYVISESTAAYTKIGGKLLSAASLTFSWIEFAQSTGEFQRATHRRQRLEEMLAAADASLTTLRNQASADEMRRGCLDALENDIRGIGLRSCPNLQVP